MTAPEATGGPGHWDDVYSRKALDQVSWFEPVPARSLEWIADTGIASDAAVIDVGGGASTLVDELIGRGFRNLAVLDISEEAIRKVAERLGERRRFVNLRAHDVTTFVPPRTYDLWHDRAVFHFLTAAADRQRYAQVLRLATHPGSHVLISTFGPEGPMRCSGLETCRYDAGQLAGELGAEFTLAHSAVEMHTTPGGARQQFLHTHFLRD
jgi:hypothetical protein